MKLKLVLATIILLSSCAKLESLTQVGNNATAEEKFRACAINEVSAKMKAGTLFNQGFTATKDEIVSTCLKKLALQAAGIDAEADSITDGILSKFIGSGK